MVSGLLLFGVFLKHFLFVISTVLSHWLLCRSWSNDLVSACLWDYLREIFQWSPRRIKGILEGISPIGYLDNLPHKSFTWVLNYFCPTICFLLIINKYEGQYVSLSLEETSAFPLSLISFLGFFSHQISHKHTESVPCIGLIFWQDDFSLKF